MDIKMNAIKYTNHDEEYHDWNKLLANYNAMWADEDEEEAEEEEEEEAEEEAEEKTEEEPEEKTEEPAETEAEEEENPAEEG